MIGLFDSNPSKTFMFKFSCCICWKRISFVGLFCSHVAMSTSVKPSAFESYATENLDPSSKLVFWMSGTMYWFVPLLFKF